MSGTAIAPDQNGQLIFQAIPKVMASVGAIEKHRKNSQQGYQFRGIDDVFSAFQRPLAEHGLFYVPEVLQQEHEQVPTKSGGMMNYTRLRVAYTLYASDGSFVRAVVAGEAMDAADKSTNKAMSAALKYFLLQIFCVPTEQDDADAETHEMAARPKAVEQPANNQAARPAPAPRPQATTAKPAAKPSGKAPNNALSNGQRSAIERLCEATNWDAHDLAQTQFNCSLDALTAIEAGQIIQQLQAELDQRRARAGA